jgi:hypothetical protein
VGDQNDQCVLMICHITMNTLASLLNSSRSTCSHRDYCRVLENLRICQFGQLQGRGYAEVSAPSASRGPQSGSRPSIYRVVGPDLCLHILVSFSTPTPLPVWVCHTMIRNHSVIRIFPQFIVFSHNHLPLCLISLKFQNLV